MNRTRTSKVLAIAALLFSGLEAMAAITRPVALSGSSPPGTSLGIVFNDFGVPYLNNSQQVAFTASLAGPGVDTSNQNGIWSGGGGSLALVARTGDTLPGRTDTYSSFDSLVLNNVGKVAFHANVKSFPFPSEAILSDRDGDLQIVVSASDVAPGLTNSATFRKFAIESRLAFNNAGDIGFTAEAGPTNLTGIWVDRNHALNLVAASLAPAANLDRPLNRAYYSRPMLDTLNERGEAAFTSRISGSNYSYGLFAEHGETVEYIALSSSSPGKLSVDELGYSTFARTRNWSPYKYRDLVSELELGSPLVGSDSAFSGYNFNHYSYFYSTAEKIIDFTQYSAFEKLGFVASLAYVTTDGPNLDQVISPIEYGIWSEFGGRLTPVTRSGHQAPGAEEGVVFDSFNAGFNREGRTVFLAQLAGPSVSAENNTGLWIQDDTGSLAMIARTGALFKVSPGDFRTVASLDYSGGSVHASGQSGGFNDTGDFLFRATFTDGSSGLFLYTTVPEPGFGLWALAIALLAAFWALKGTKRSPT